MREARHQIKDDRRRGRRHQMCSAEAAFAATSTTAACGQKQQKSGELSEAIHNHLQLCGFLDP